MHIRNACSHRVVLRTLHFLVGASIIGCWIWATDEVGRHVVAFLTAIGAASPPSWQAGTSTVIVRGDIFLKRMLLGGATVVLSLAALYSAVRLCLAVGSLVFEMIGPTLERPRSLGERSRRT
ncbi:MAG: hypothetical protein WC617_11605 [Rhodanobacter sp.]|jgi:hypothetical protein